MADLYNIYKNCGNCKGTGIVSINNLPHNQDSPSNITCPECNGTGEFLWGQMREEELPEPL